MSSAQLKQRRLDFHSFDEILADIDHLHAVGYRRSGNWDLSQILEHLGEGVRTAIHGSSHRGPWVLRKWIGQLRELHQKNQTNEGKYQGSRLVASWPKPRRIRSCRAIPKRIEDICGIQRSDSRASLTWIYGQSRLDRHYPYSRFPSP